MTPCWREMDSNFRFLVVRPSNRHGRSDRFLETWAHLLGNRRFESISLQRRVRCEPLPPPDATGLQPAEMLRAMPFSMAYRHSRCLLGWEE